MTTFACALSRNRGVPVAPLLRGAVCPPRRFAPHPSGRCLRNVILPGAGDDFADHEAIVLGLFREKMVHPGGFEPPTARFVAEYSIQLSYGCIRENCFTTLSFLVLAIISQTMK